MPADYHTHTPLCHHAEGNPQEYIEAALRAGLSEYGVSCHAPVEEEPFDNWRMLSSDLPEYFEWVEAARNYAHNRIPVRLVRMPHAPHAPHAAAGMAHALRHAVRRLQPLEVLRVTLARLLEHGRRRLLRLRGRRRHSRRPSARGT
mgnify:CR=1 FL=1